MDSESKKGQGKIFGKFMERVSGKVKKTLKNISTENYFEAQF